MVSFSDAMAAPKREEVQNANDSLAAPTSLHPIEQTPGVHGAAGANLSGVGQDQAELANVLKVGADFATDEFNKDVKEEFVNGQMAEEQGKALDQYNMWNTSAAFVSGYRNMQAQTIADKLFSEQLNDIKTDDYQLTADQYREKMNAGFSKVLTGNQETDRYITQLTLANNSKLAQAQVAAHEAWKVDETTNSYRDLIASKSKLAETSSQDLANLITLLKNPKSIPGMEHISDVDTKAAVAGGIVQALNEGSDKALTVLKSIVTPVKGPQPVVPGNIDLASRPSVHLKNGDIATVRSMSFNEDGQEVLIPTVVGNRVVSNKEAIDEYHKTGKFLGKFDNPADATVYAQNLHNQQATVYTTKDISALNGAGFNATQIATIGNAYDRFREKKQEEFNQSYQDDLHSLLENASSGKITLNEAKSQYLALTEQYGKDGDQYRTLGYTSLLANYGVRDPRILKITLNADQKARNGTPWGTVVKSVNSQLNSIGANSATRWAVLQSVTSGVEGFQKREEAKADAAAMRAAARRERIAEAVRLANSGYAFALDGTGRRMAFMARDQAENQAINNARAAAKSKGLFFDETAAQERKAAHMAQYISVNGVVSPIHADMWTAGFTSIMPGGKISPLTRQSVAGFAALAKINPQLAMAHLQGADAKMLGKAVMDNVAAGMDYNQAINMAAARINPTVSSSRKERSEAASVSKDLVEDRIPGMFVGLRNMLGIGDAAAAVSSPLLQTALIRRANNIRRQYPNLTDVQAVDQAGAEMADKVGVVGPNVLISKYKPIADEFGLGGRLHDPSQLSSIVMHVLRQKDIGPRAFGKQWNSVFGLLDRAERALGGDPHLHMSLDNVSHMLVVTAYNNDGSLGTSVRIPTHVIGDVWKHSGLDPDQLQSRKLRMPHNWENPANNLTY